MKNKKYYIKMAAGIFLLSVAIMLVNAIPTQAMAPVNIIKELQNLSGEHKYMSYYDNYYLDYIPGGMLEWADDMMNKMVNSQFDIIKLYGLIICIIFYNALDFNLAEMLADEINVMQASLRGSVFEPLFLIGFAGSAVILLKRFAKRDMIGSFVQILKVIGIVVLSYLVVSQSGTVMREATNLTASVGAQILSGTNGSTTGDYAAESVGEIWLTLVHRPWLELEFGDDDYSKEDMLYFLTSEPVDADREEKVNAWEGDAFKGTRSFGKMGFMICYMIPFFIKGTLFLVIGGLLLVMQLMAVLYTFLAPLVLILALIPGYEGILSRWLRKLLESQLSILVMYFICGILLKIDGLLFDNLSDTWGWMVVLVLQIVLYLGVILKRNEIFGAMGKIGISNPGAMANAGMRGGSMIKSAVAHAIVAGRQRAVVKSGTKAGVKAAKAEDKTGKETRKGKKQPERPVMGNAKKNELAVVPTGGKAAGYKNNTGYTTSSDAHREPLRPKSVTFTERQVTFEFEPSGATTDPYSEAGTVQRPRMDSFYTEVNGEEWSNERAEPTQGRWNGNYRKATYSQDSGRAQEGYGGMQVRRVNQAEIPAATFREVSDSREQHKREEKRKKIIRPQSVEKK